jgi:hypothetical protein
MNINHLNIVGCGGVGLKIARELSFSPPIDFETVTLWDSDTIEDRNLERQIFTNDQVNMYKSEATANLFFPEAETMGDLNTMSLSDLGYTSKENKWNAIFVMATDNVESRLLILDVLDKYGSKDSMIFSAANATADDGLGIGSTAWVYKNKWRKTKKDPRVRLKLSTKDNINVGRPCTEASEPQTGIANSGAAIRCVELLTQYCLADEDTQKHLAVQHSIFWKQTAS